MLDLTKPVQTRDGRKVRIIYTDRKGAVPIIALVQDSDGKESPLVYTSDGLRFYAKAEIKDHLINVPQRHKHADVIIAWANGAEIEFREFIDQPWLPTVQPEWYRSYQYRVKPA